MDLDETTITRDERDGYVEVDIQYFIVHISLFLMIFHSFFFTVPFVLIICFANLFLALQIKNDEFKDSTYHCPFILSTKIDKVDPSLALGFLCRTEDDYNELAQRLRTVVFIVLS